MTRRLIIVLYPFVDAVRRLCIRLVGGSTLGVRGIVVDKEERVLLVKHTYVAGWYCPGGGVRRSEKPIDALRRELQEEVGISVRGAPHFVDLFPFTWAGAADFWAVYGVTNYGGAASVQDTNEIDQVAWFDLNELPADLEKRTGEILNAWKSIDARD